MIAWPNSNSTIEALRQLLSAKASARGWPQVRYRPPFYYTIDRATHEKTRLLMTNIACAAGETTITVCGGHSSWGVFLARAGYHDLLGANAMLTFEEGSAGGPGDWADRRHPVPV